MEIDAPLARKIVCLGVHGRATSAAVLTREATTGRPDSALPDELRQLEGNRVIPIRADANGTSTLFTSFPGHAACVAG